jgi:hypothetical protein
MLQTILLALGAILLCSAHLCVGFFAGYRLAASQKPDGRRSLSDVPSYFPVILELLERSQQLHLQTGSFVQELPEKLLLAVARLMESADKLKTHLPEQAATELLEGQRSALPAESSRAPGFLNPWKTKTTRSSPGGMHRRANRASADPAKFSLIQTPSHQPTLPDRGIDLDHPDLAMTDMMNLVVKANRETKAGTHSEPRYPYPTQQFVAFCADEMPPPEEFVQVQCLDVSASGISFLLDHPPTSDTLIISLGKTPQLTFMAAKVMNQHYMMANGQEGYRVGCQFLKRLDRSAYAWDEQRATIVSAADSATAETNTELVVGEAALLR